MKRVASPGSMYDTGCLGLVHWDDPEGWYGEGMLDKTKEGRSSGNPSWIKASEVSTASMDRVDLGTASAWWLYDCTGDPEPCVGAGYL